MFGLSKSTQQHTSKVLTAVADNEVDKERSLITLTSATHKTIN
jgi:hypothetical protein